MRELVVAVVEATLLVCEVGLLVGVACILVWQLKQLVDIIREEWFN